ncbi:MAG: AbrB family transcriptional regulator [Candidatus Accumulibacter sp.]|jgi:membrane AbrB-like protein|nr:AbrB family transcriptional regulator [Accumulibacter sp.]
MKESSRDGPGGAAGHAIPNFLADYNDHRFPPRHLFTFSGNIMRHRGRRLLPLKQHPAFFQWAVLLALSLGLALAFDAVRMPAALLLGAMLAAILIAVADASPRVARKPFIVAQGVIGCLVARGITSDILVSLRENWLFFVSVTMVIVFVCSAMGWMLARQKILPGTTAVWGCSPGGASVMTAMADDYGGDMRLVAVMQYMRVVLVTILATVVAHFWIGGAPPDHGVFSNWLTGVSWPDLAATLSLAVPVALLAGFLKIPGGPLLIPLIVGSTLQARGLMTITLPPWILALAYITLGWSVGLRFTRQSLNRVKQALPSIAASIVCMILMCAGVAAALTQITDIDPLTAYLATSPGGLDSVAIIAATSGVNMPFVMAFQTARLLVVIVTGPALARFMARRL